MMDAVYEKYFRNNIPHIWCAGCGNGIVMGAFARAMEKLGYDQDEVVVISGIGCSSRITGYLDFNTLHTAHGRALPFATGVKLAEPRLKVFVIMGDGDCAAIGGNHFIHACRRNIDGRRLRRNGPLWINRPDVRHLQTGSRRRRDLCRPGRCVPRGYDDQSDRSGGAAQRLFCAGDYLYLPDFLWTL